MKKLLVIVLFILGLGLVFSTKMVFAEEPEEVDEQPVPEVEEELPVKEEEPVEEEDEVNSWFEQFFSAEKVAMYLSWVAYIGTIIGLVANIKKLKQENNLTLDNVKSEVKGAIGKEVAVKFEKYLPNILSAQEKTNEIMSIFAKILAFSQENTPESKVAILNLIQELGVVSKDIVDNAKGVIEDIAKQEEEHKEEVNNKLDELIEQYNGTSVDY